MFLTIEEVKNSSIFKTRDLIEELISGKEKEVRKTSLNLLTKKEKNIYIIKNIIILYLLEHKEDRVYVDFCSNKNKECMVLLKDSFFEIFDKVLRNFLTSELVSDEVFSTYELCELKIIENSLNIAFSNKFGNTISMLLFYPIKPAQIEMISGSFIKKENDKFVFLEQKPVMNQKHKIKVSNFITGCLSFLDFVDVDTTKIETFIQLDETISNIIFSFFNKIKLDFLEINDFI